MDKKQTAVEYLYERLEAMIPRTILYSSDKQKYFEIALKMEVQQQRLIYEGMLQNVGTSVKQSDLPTFEHYYNETYGK
jgi:hypothetical protein